MDKLRAMATFVDIVQAGSLTAAADQRGVSLTAVVRALAGLEAVLGVRLLNRSTRRMALTEEGHAYFERCQRILGEVAEAEHALSAQQQAPVGRVAMTAPQLFGRMHVAPLVCDFLLAHPAMQVDLLLLDRNVDLLEEGLDLALRFGALPDSGLVALPLGQTRRVVCAAPAYLERQGLPRCPEDLLQHRGIRFSGVSASPLWSFGVTGQQRALAVPPVLTTNQLDVAREACLRGVGVGRFFGYQVRTAVADGSLRVLLDGFEPAPVPAHLLYPHSRLLSSRVRALCDWMVPALREVLAGGL